MRSRLAVVAYIARADNVVSLHMLLPDDALVQMSNCYSDDAKALQPHS